MVVASVWGAQAAKEQEASFPDCRFCRGPEMVPNRERWGCDVPTEEREPVFGISCTACEGEECEKCGGKGERPMHRCPSSILRDAENRSDVEAFFQAYLMFANRNALPVAGGWWEQPATFCQAVEVADAERGMWEREMQEAREAKRKKPT